MQVSVNDGLKICLWRPNVVSHLAQKKQGERLLLQGLFKLILPDRRSEIV